MKEKGLDTLAICVWRSRVCLLGCSHPRHVSWCQYVRLHFLAALFRGCRNDKLVTMSGCQVGQAMSMVCFGRRAFERARKSFPPIHMHNSSLLHTHTSLYTPTVARSSSFALSLHSSCGWDIC